ncbi:dTDP-4-dehydrorhamnose 3,5-epimerase [Bacteroidia bacterium]|nr:dTDP-4-dehydrorhamnose 3,5-epimerase [Bacteroidia bacterium]MDC0560996.1 dTDP-4-dehydrorhamnose 3,5-epimerase [Bacteroidia bacterium]
MDVSTTNIEGLLVIQPKVFGDERGYFFESFRDDVLNNHGVYSKFVQDNQSKSNKGILRGLHFQKAPHAQGKLVRVVKGSVLDIAVDIRTNSPTYGHHFSIELNEVNKTIFYIPPGFAHGFLTLEDNTLFSYKCTNYYNLESEGSVLWNSESLNIDWGIENPILSEKDNTAPNFKDFKSPF